MADRLTDVLFKPFQYSNQTTPDRYRCECGASGVRLYRRYQTMLDNQRLLCRACALKDQKKTDPDLVSEHSIGWLVAAVPTEEGDTYWGYTSVPEAGVKWWDNLPKELKDGD